MGKSISNIFSYDEKGKKKDLLLSTIKESVYEMENFKIKKETFKVYILFKKEEMFLKEFENREEANLYFQGLKQGTWMIEILKDEKMI